MDAADLNFGRDGAERHDRAALPVMAALETALASTGPARPGVRLRHLAALLPLLSADGPVGRVAAARLGTAVRPVRAILFDKTPAANWSLAWHQDRMVAVRARHDLPGWHRWSRKDGLQHVEPPFALLERMVTLRIHLDPVPDDNAPLLIAPGSH